MTRVRGYTHNIVLLALFLCVQINTIEKYTYCQEERKIENKLKRAEAFSGKTEQYERRVTSEEQKSALSEVDGVQWLRLSSICI